MQRIFFATTNEGKIREAREILRIPVEPIELELDEVQTLDPIRCVEKKAEAAYKSSKKAILVEDTCLFFDAWNGLPGVFIDYFMKTVGVEGLLRLLRHEENRAAAAQTSLCYFDGKQNIVTTGLVVGSISIQARGDSGFGWDPIFIPEGYSKTFAEMGSEEKNALSMRRIALDTLKQRLHLH